MRDIFGDRIHPVVVYGAGGHGRETVQLIEDINAHRARWDVLGFIDDDRLLLRKRIHGVKVLGTRQDLPHILAETEPDEVVVALTHARPALLREIITALENIIKELRAAK